MTRSRRAACLGALLGLATSPLEAQDTTALVQAAVPRHVLAVDTTRLHPVQRSYEMAVVGPDSTFLIGQRDIALFAAAYAGSPAWLLVESRSGLVPAAESLYLSPEMRLLHFSSTLGLSRMSVEFGADSLFGVVASPGGRRNIVLAGRPDLVASIAMIETLLPLLPLGMEWNDSVSVLSIDAAGATILPGALAVIGEEETVVDSITRPNWVVALRTDSSNVLFWVDKETADVRRIQLALPAHVGRLIEMRARAAPAEPQAPPP